MLSEIKLIACVCLYKCPHMNVCSQTGMGRSVWLRSCGPVAANSLPSEFCPGLDVLLLCTECISETACDYIFVHSNFLPNFENGSFQIPLVLSIITMWFSAG